MRGRPTVGATALAETVVVCDEAVLRALPRATAMQALSGSWRAGETQTTGALDACRLGAERVGSLERLAEIARAGKLADVDGAFQLALQVPESLLLARDAIGHRTLF